jgi:hypothetical protein
MLHGALTAGNGAMLLFGEVSVLFPKGIQFDSDFTKSDGRYGSTSTS